MKTLKDIEYLNGVRVLVRVDFNVPIKNAAVVDDFRIRAALPTIDHLISKGAKVILMSHLESADGTNPSLMPVVDSLKKLGRECVFIKDFNKALDTINDRMNSGSCALLENLRFFDGEKKNDRGFARELASLGDIYVNDAFSASHREHASIVGIPRLMPSYAGLQMENEVKNLSRAFNPMRPFLFILGGAKFNTKLPLLQKFLSIADSVFVGGALANDLLKAKGYEIGKSLTSFSRDLRTGGQDLTDIIGNPRLIMPVDVINEQTTTVAADQMKATDRNVDMGPKTLEGLRSEVMKSKFILWNGPVGFYEGGSKAGTIEVAKMLGEATANGTETVIGGGDTLAAIKELDGRERFSFISTGGGAMLDFLADGTLSGIEALNTSKA